MRLTGLLILMMIVLAACNADAPSAISFTDIPETGDAERGAMLFSAATNGTTPCSGCHIEGASGAPDLVNYGAVAGTRVEGQEAREYTFYSIVEPGQHITEGFGNAMPADYDDKLEPQDIADLMAYLLGL